MGDHPMRRVTEKLTSDPGSWGSVRGEVLETFDALAAEWESRLGPALLTSLAAGLPPLPPPATPPGPAGGPWLAAGPLSGTLPDALVVGVHPSAQIVRPQRA